METARRLGVRSAALFDELGSVSLKLRDQKAALAAYEQLLAAKPPADLASKVRTIRGWISAGYGDPPHLEGARADFAEAVRLAPAHANAHAGLGYLAALRRASSEAKGAAAQALWHGDQNYSVLHNVACIYAELSKVETAQDQQDKDMALDVLRRAVTLCRQRGDGNLEIVAIKADSSLQVLSDRPEFHDLIQESNRNAGTRP